MKFLFKIGLFFISVNCCAQSWTWVDHSGVLYLKNGNDSIAITGVSPYTSAQWGGIFGNITNQTDLQTSLSAKQATLVSATNIKTINGNSLLGSGDLVVGGGAAAWGGITGTLADQTDLQNALNAKLATNGNGSSLTGLTKTQVGLANADNTSDANKPVSTATQTALDAKLATNGNGSALTGITASQIGATTIGGNIFALANPGAITFPRINADNTATARSAADMRTDLGLVIGTNVLAPNGNGSALTGLTAAQVSLGNVTNESKATMFTNAVLTGTFTAPNGTITNVMLATPGQTFQLSLATSFMKF